MATGDAAAAAGLATFTPADRVNQTHDALNKRGDELAAALTRLKTLEDAPRTVGGDFNGDTNGDGDVVIPHTLGVVPKGVSIIDRPVGPLSTERTWLLRVKTAKTITVRCYRTDGANPAPFANNPIGVTWMAVS